MFVLKLMNTLLSSLRPGFFFVQYPELMLEKEAKLLYHEWLTKDCHSKKKCQVEIYIWLCMTAGTP